MFYDYIKDSYYDYSRNISDLLLHLKVHRNVRGTWAKKIYS